MPGARRRAFAGAAVLAGAVTLQAGLGIVTLLHQAPIPLALAHQMLAIIVFTIAVVHAEGLSHRLAYSGAAVEPGGAGRMIKSDTVDGIAVLTLTHGKANALDIELCDALAARFQGAAQVGEKAVVLTGQGKIFSAGVDLKRLSRRGRRLYSSIPARPASPL